MTQSKLTELVTEAIALDREIKDMDQRLKDIKAKLVKAADVEDEKTETEGGGWSVEFKSVDGSIARITQPGAKLKASVDGASPLWANVQSVLKERVNRLFLPCTKHSPVEDFRTVLSSCCGTADEKKLLKLLTVKSSPTVSFETKEAA